jgi:molecular chaperone GrpE
LNLSKAKDEEPEIRITDRRRIYLDNDGTPAAQEDAEVSSLKPSYVEELESRTKAAEQRALDVQKRFEEARAMLQRETDETRQRLNRAADERAQREGANFIAKLLPVLDNLQRATEAAETGTAGEDLLDGVRRTTESFERALREVGVEPVASVGGPFNPELHEAVETMEAEPDMDGMIMGEFSRGYRMGDRLLRPARVKVGRALSNRQTAR